MNRSNVLHEVVPFDRRVVLCRRALEHPQYRIVGEYPSNADGDRRLDAVCAAVIEGGLLAELLYDGQPRILDDLSVRADDPAWEYLGDQQSLMALPLYETGSAPRMVVLASKQRQAFAQVRLHDAVWRLNLFDRAARTVVLAEHVDETYDLVQRELQAITNVKRSLMRACLPRIPRMEFALYYQTAERVGGDYYDVFPLKDGKWGLLVADAAGHGPRAAMMMAVTHAIAHTYAGPTTSPSELLNFVNRRLATLHPIRNGTFVTAFYAVFDPRSGELLYSSAGHNPPRLRRINDERIQGLDGARGLPLGVIEEEVYDDDLELLKDGDEVLFYTDGITEALSVEGEQFGVERLDQVLADGVLGERCLHGRDLIKAVVEALKAFSPMPPTDDRTLVTVQVSDSLVRQSSQDALLSVTP